MQIGFIITARETKKGRHGGSLGQEQF